MIVHDGVNCATTNAQLAATAGLRKNLNVSKPSIGASFQAPPNAEIQPKKLPTVITTSHVGQLDPQLFSSARIAKNTPQQASATTMPIEIRFFASFIGLPNMPNCIGMKYLD